MLKPRSLVLALLLGTGASAPPQRLVFPEVDHILVEKAARTMTLYGVDGSVTLIRNIQLGDAPLGPKQFEGDERTPVALVSTSPEREDTILVRDPFVD